MHILMLLSNPFRPDPRVLKEASSLAAQGYQVTVICWDRQAEYTPEEMLPCGVQVLRIQNVRSSYGIGAGQLLRLPAFWLAVLPYLRRLQPDLIHCHDFDTLPAGLLWGKLKGIPVVYDAHEYYADLCKPRLKGISGSWLYHTIRIAEHTGARFAAAVVTVDETLASIYHRYNAKVVVIGHFPQVKLAEEKNPVFTRRELKMVYVGRLSVDRGLLIYIRILRHLRQMGVPVRLKLAGIFTPASDEVQLQSAAQGIEDCLEVIGWVPYAQIPDLLRSADLGLSILLPEPRYVAALPVKLFEYMAAGLPVVASNFPAIASIMEDSECGMVVNPADDPVMIAEKIKNWWEHPEAARLLGENGRQAILKRYNWEILMGRLDSLYRSLLKT